MIHFEGHGNKQLVSKLEVNGEGKDLGELVSPESIHIQATVNELSRAYLYIYISVCL